MVSIDLFTEALLKAEALVTAEYRRCDAGEASAWEPDLLKTVAQELQELIDHAERGIVYFPYGKTQRMLQSTHIMTDSLLPLADTAPGKALLRVQELYNKA